MLQTLEARPTDAPSSGADAPHNALDGNFHTRFKTNEDQAPALAIRG